jgi:hypothetical protein
VHDVGHIGARHSRERGHQLAGREELRAHAPHRNAVDRFFAQLEAQVRRLGLPVGDRLHGVAGAHQRLAKRALGPVAEVAANPAEAEDQNAHSVVRRLQIDRLQVGRLAGCRLQVGRLQVAGWQVAGCRLAGCRLAG